LDNFTCILILQNVLMTFACLPTKMPDGNLKTGSGPVIIGSDFNDCLMAKIGDFCEVRQPIKIVINNIMNILPSSERNDKYRNILSQKITSKHNKVKRNLNIFFLNTQRNSFSFMYSDTHTIFNHRTELAVDKNRKEIQIKFQKDKVSFLSFLFN